MHHTQAGMIQPGSSYTAKPLSFGKLIKPLTDLRCHLVHAIIDPNLVVTPPLLVDAAHPQVSLNKVAIAGSLKAKTT